MTLGFQHYFVKINTTLFPNQHYFVPAEDTFLASQSAKAESYKNSKK